MTELRAPLTYSDLDGLAFACERGRHPSAGARYEPYKLGPFVEMSHLSAIGVLPPLATTSWLHGGVFEPLLHAMTGASGTWVSAAGSMGLLQCGAEYSDTAWTGFAMSAKRAATTKGIGSQLAAELVAAMGELYNNVFEHSFAHRTGFATYHANSECFDFAVVDRGVGLLGSLTKSPKFRLVSAHDEALRLALAPGNSRFAEPGRGLGFTRLFTGLANRESALRFRTGDHALEVDGRTQSLDQAHAAQKTSIEGFVATASYRHERR